MNALVKKLSVRQVASFASLAILALALPIGLYLTSLTQDLRQQAQQFPISSPITPPNTPTPTPTPSPSSNTTSNVYCESNPSLVTYNQTGIYVTRLSPYSAWAGANDAIVGYQWDFEGDGVWDADRFNDHGWIDHTYNQNGVYYPKYRVRGIFGYSNTCSLNFTINISGISPSPSPSPTTTNKFDMNNDNRITITDYTLFIAGFINALTQ